MKLLKALAYVLLMIAANAPAEVLYDLTFENPPHQVGQVPSVGAGPSKISSIQFGSPRIVNDQPLLNGNCLEFEGYKSYEQISLELAGGAGLIVVDFDIVTKNLIDSLYGFSVLLDTPEVRTLNFHGPLKTIYTYKPFGGGNLQSFEDGRKYHVTMAVDTIANTWKVSIDGVQRYQSTINATSVNTIRLGLSPAYGGASDQPSTKVYVDNFKVDQPGSGGARPLVQDLEATNILTREATLNANVNPKNAATSVSFVYSDPSGVTRSTALQLIPKGSAFLPVTARIGELKPHTIYQYRVIATNSFGSTEQGSQFSTGNSTPVAAPDQLHTPSGTQPFPVAVLANDHDADGDLLTLRPLQPGDEGYDPRVTIEGGILTFHPDPGFNGNAVFQYGVVDGFGGSAKGTVSLSNNPPVAQDLTMHVLSSGEAAKLPLDLRDPDGDTVTLIGVGSSSFGEVSFTANSVTYLPEPNFLGWDQVSYTVSDGRGGIATATIYVSLARPLLKSWQMSGNAVPNQSNEVWKSFGIPSILALGNAGWLARISRPSGTYEGIFSGPLGAPVLRLRTGNSVPDHSGKAIQNAAFADIEEPVFAGENFAFKGRLDGAGLSALNASGIWVYDSEELHLVAREGFDKPTTNGSYFRSLQSLVMPDPSLVFFTAEMWDGTRSLWVWRKEAGVSRILQEGQTIKDPETAQSIGRVASFQVISQVPGSSGHARYDVSQRSLDALVHLDNGRSAIITVNDRGGLMVIERTLDQRDDGIRLLRFGRPSSPGGGRFPVGTVEYIYTNGDRTRQTAIMDFEDAVIVALAGSAAPGTAAETFLNFKDPVAGLTATQKSLVAFQASISGSAKTNSGIWFSNGGEPVLAARKGHPAPGANGLTFREFKSLSVIDGNGPLFTATLTPGNENGCWAADSHGELHLLMRTGEVFEGKTIRSFDALSTIPGSAGQRRSWAETPYGAVVIFRVYFTDGTQGIATVSIP